MLTLLTLLHLAVDGVCSATLYAYGLAEADFEKIVLVCMLYNCVAFGGQWLVGWFLDKHIAQTPYCLGISVTLLSMGALLPAPMLMRAVLLGMGNCIFHAAAGSLVLRRSNNFQAPGIFVSSGVLGLALGLGGYVDILPFLGICVLGTSLCLIRLHREKRAEVLDNATIVQCPPLTETLGKQTYLGPHFTFPTQQQAGTWTGGLCAVLLLACVALRGFAGHGSHEEHLLIFACTMALGKALGGLFCDRYGYNKTLCLLLMLGLAAQLGSGLLPQLVFIFSCNMTMPITLRLLHICYPSFPGLMFGLAAGCLLPGAYFTAAICLPPQGMLVIQTFSLFFVGYLLTHRYRKWSSQ